LGYGSTFLLKELTFSNHYIIFLESAKNSILEKYYEIY
jgi:hypothetical protein